MKMCSRNYGRNRATLFSFLICYCRERCSCKQRLKAGASVSTPGEIRRAAG